MVDGARVSLQEKLMAEEIMPLLPYKGQDGWNDPLVQIRMQELGYQADGKRKKEDDQGQLLELQKNGTTSYYRFRSMESFRSRLQMSATK